MTQSLSNYGLLRSVTKSAVYSLERMVKVRWDLRITRHGLHCIGHELEDSKATDLKMQVHEK